MMIRSHQALLEVVPVFTVALERVDRDDGSVVVVERVVVGRNLAPDALDACGVEPRERDGETIPEFLLELTASLLLVVTTRMRRAFTTAHQLGREDCLPPASCPDPTVSAIEQAAAEAVSAPDAPARAGTEARP
jgi:hypothetical protein